jgi:hypothetical protein
MIGTFILAAIVFCGSYAVLRSKLTLHVNLLFAATKSVTFLLYFSIFAPNLPFTGLDDNNYLLVGRAICNTISKNDLNDILIAVFSVSNGKHILYPIFNCVTSLFPTDHYQTTVAVNAIIASYCAHIFLDIFQIISGYNHKEEFRFYAAFIVFLPDFWVWTTLLNFKEAILCTLFAYVYRNVFLRTNWSPLIIVPLLFMLFFTRYYSIVFFLPALAFVYLRRLIISCSHGKLKRKDLIFSTVIFLFIAIFIDQINYYSVNGLMLFLNGLTLDLYNLAKFLLSPLPTNINHENWYLILISVFNPILLCLYLCGLLLMITSGDVKKITLVIISITIVSFYAVIPELSGPRQRLLVSNFNYIIIAFALKYVIRKLRCFGSIYNHVS